jgi:poly(3-hydroxybutyrate) depolymerase
MTSMSGFRVSLRLIGLTFVFAAAGITPASAQGDTPPLRAYNAAIKESSISGISSGAFMAVQFGISWSSAVKGVGVIAGGPYYCARGTAAEGLTGKLLPDHVALHGCKQNFDAVGDRYTRHAGYNEWADTNQLIILYPQTTAGNPLTDFATPISTMR